jgi:hypothetical protein
MTAPRPPAEVSVAQSLARGAGLMVVLTLVTLAFAQIDWPLIGLMVVIGIAIAGGFWAPPQGERRPLSGWAGFLGIIILALTPIAFVASSENAWRVLGTARVPVEGLMPRPELGLRVTSPNKWRGYTPTQLDVAPLLPPGTAAPAMEASIWVVRGADAGGTGRRHAWSLPAREALLIPGTLHGLALSGVRDAAERSGLRVPASPTLVSWQADAAATLAAERHLLAVIAAASYGSWVLLVLLERWRQARGKPPPPTVQRPAPRTPRRRRSG